MCVFTDTSMQKPEVQSWRDICRMRGAYLSKRRMSCWCAYRGSIHYQGSSIIASSLLSPDFDSEVLVRHNFVWSNHLSSLRYITGARGTALSCHSSAFCVSSFVRDAQHVFWYTASGHRSTSRLVCYMIIVICACISLHLTSMSDAYVTFRPITTTNFWSIHKVRDNCSGFLHRFCIIGQCLAKQ